jgi:acyl carrier protein
MESLRESLKVMICEALQLEDVSPADIEDDAPLFGEGLGLDSVDALELAMEIENRYGLKISKNEESRHALASVAALEKFLIDSGAVSSEQASAPGE